MVVVKAGWKNYENWYKVQYKHILAESNAHRRVSLGSMEGAVFDVSGARNVSLEFTQAAPPAAAFGKPPLVQRYIPRCHWERDSTHQGRTACVWGEVVCKRPIWDSHS